MALSKGRQVKKLLPGKKSAPMLGSDETIYQGGLVVLDTDGFALTATTDTDIIAVGVACSNGGLDVWTNGGSDGDVLVEYEEGVFAFNNSASDDEITDADVGKACYIVDDETVALTNDSNARSGAGFVARVEGGLVYVNVSAENSRAIAASVIPTGNTYTQTYSTANRTVAAPTAAALTVADGTGTNDGTIGAITDNASTIAAVQEIAAMIAKLVADDLDNRQTLTALIDDLQTAGIVD